MYESSVVAAFFSIARNNHTYCAHKQKYIYAKKDFHVEKPKHIGNASIVSHVVRW